MADEEGQRGVKSADKAEAHVMIFARLSCAQIELLLTCEATLSAFRTLSESQGTDILSLHQDRLRAYGVQFQYIYRSCRHF